MSIKDSMLGCCFAEENEMTTAKNLFLMLFCIALIGTGEANERAALQKLKYQGLEVKFMPICQEGEIWLSGRLQRE
jgi:hypothetical protein